MVAYREESKNSGEISPDQGRTLLGLARHAIAEKLGLSGTKPETSAPIFSQKRATFVTLKSGKNLRGCIGSLAAVEPLAEGIRRNAVNAAFHDPRFPSLTEKEFAGIHISVSVLTPARPLSHGGGQDLISKLNPGMDGVIIRHGSCSATFLPQVWEQLPDPESFLNHLCHKAGLPMNAWQNPDLEVSIYQALYFAEATGL